MKKFLSAVSVFILVLIFANIFVFPIYKIPTASMVPVLMPDDRVIVNKLIYGPKIPFTNLRLPGFKNPQRGEVIVFIPPQEAKKPWFLRKRHYIKRLVGLGKESLMIKEGNLYINGKEVVDPRMANYYYNQGPYAKDSKEIVIPQGKYFFLGDNSISSSDSRVWGFVDKKDLIGKAIFVWSRQGGINMVE